MKKTYSKDWCQGFCHTCGVSCADYCESEHNWQKTWEEFTKKNAEKNEKIFKLEKEIADLKTIIKEHINLKCCPGGFRILEKRIKELCGEDY